MSSSKVFTVKKIAQLCEESYNLVLVAVVIAKSDARFFSGLPSGRGHTEADSNNMNRSSTVRGVLTLTLRDTETDTINCTIWGSESTILRYNDLCDVGDVVDVHQPNVSLPMFGRCEQYSPTVSSPYCLTINERTLGSQITRHEGSQLHSLKGLLNVPMIQQRETIPLADIVASGSVCLGEMMNVLVVVRAVRPVRQVRVARSNEIKSFREVVVMDHSHAGVLIKFWSDSFIRWAERWTPLATVLLIVNARVELNRYHKTINLAMGPKTIITQDPKLPQLDQLLQQSKSTQDIDGACSLTSGPIDPASINTVMTVQQILNRTTKDMIHGDDHFTALCYAIITRLDLDGMSRIVSKRCAHCRALLYEPGLTCPKNCRADGAEDKLESFFNISVDLTDHTGTLSGCRLVAEVAEHVLRCNVATFMSKSDAQKTQLKWSLLLERCAVRLIVKRPTAVRFQNLFSIVACVPADPAELEAKLKVY